MATEQKAAVIASFFKWFELENRSDTCQIRDDGNLVSVATKFGELPHFLQKHFLAS